MRRVHLLAVWLWGVLPLLLTYRSFRGGALRGWFGAALMTFTLLWWASALGLLGRRRWAPGLATLLSAIPLLIGLGQSIRRALFVIDRGGLDSLGGQGSPLAFLVGWGEEALLLLIPGLVLTVVGVLEWTRDRACPSGSEAVHRTEASA